MIFTSFNFLYFFFLVFCLYWSVRNRKIQNIILLAASYIFYGWITPWFCLLLATSTIVDFICGLGMRHKPGLSKTFLFVSLSCNLGILCIFKYYNFFIDNFQAVLQSMGLSPGIPTLQLVLPLGISFYTFRTLSYTIDIYRGKIDPRSSFIDYALFVSFFNQLQAGPIERAERFLPQIETERIWTWKNCERGFTLIILGYFKKMVIADNISFFVDKIYMLDSPGITLLTVGTFAFSIQIYVDFSGYTDIARGTAKLLGFNLVKNFNYPYFAVSPADFWRRWHMSLSRWIRDYIYIPLGGSKGQSPGRYCTTVIFTMFLCGMWHGAAWNFAIWGIYYGVLLVVYRVAGLGGSWRPQSKSGIVAAVCIMFVFTVFGWSIFRAPSIEWWIGVLTQLNLATNMAEMVSASVILAKIALYSAPLLLLLILEKRPAVYYRFSYSALHACLLIMIVIFHSESYQDFIYFQF
jgi:alginate O-acetyltransferase complex protein AlgI